MNYENILENIEEGILTITINRPKFLNALNKKTFAEIETAMNLAISNEKVKAIIFTGAGEKAFIAGADIKEFANFTDEQGTELSSNGMRIFQIIEDSPKPVIAAINGFALGGGNELALSCHLRIASENAKLGQPEVNLGVTPGYAGTQRLARYIGKTKAIELLMTAGMIGAAEAKDLGLINYVVLQEELLPKAKELLKKIMKKSPVAVAGVIKCVNAYYNKKECGFETEAKVFGDCFATEDFKEGTTAFLEKRKANFPGK
ncbi:MAG: enoyl-CoA hydratase [Bacteroidetes bacterium]|jgi:enoyl-CoA hydratase|nr:enoyl-CoA hydratase [Bacteroidota bacterium]MBT6686842.1 enoyl-CoA hydratase [Bacteroidota bacterium]MBT7144171.1 enoyl-CoA hydratase [Bacteroidota bacterium]MBT7491890.1 enoyl-CoA hydratase [Bacteroidota bacterium]